MTDYQANLILLALSCGFTSEKKNGQTYLITINNNKTLMYSFNDGNGDALLGKEAEILSIVDKRLGVNFADADLKKRFDVFFSALNDENHYFWNKAKNKN